MLLDNVNQLMDVCTELEFVGWDILTNSSVVGA